MSQEGGSPPEQRPGNPQHDPINDDAEFIRNTQSEVAERERMVEGEAQRRQTSENPEPTYVIPSNPTSGYQTASSQNDTTTSTSFPAPKGDSELYASRLFECLKQEMNNEVRNLKLRLQITEVEIKALKESVNFYHKKFNETFERLQAANKRQIATRELLDSFTRIAKDVNSQPLDNFLTNLTKLIFRRPECEVNEEEIRNIVTKFQEDVVQVAKQAIKERKDLRSKPDFASAASEGDVMSINFITMVLQIKVLSGEVVTLASRFAAAHGEDLLKKSEKISQIAKQLEDILRKCNDASLRSVSSVQLSEIESMRSEIAALRLRESDLIQQISALREEKEQLKQQTRNASNNFSSSQTPPIDRPDYQQQLLAAYAQHNAIVSNFQANEKRLQEKIDTLEDQIRSLTAALESKEAEVRNLQLQMRTLPRANQSVPGSQYDENDQQLRSHQGGLSWSQNAHLTASEENFELLQEIVSLYVEVDELRQA